jgi:hypothetical protein
MRVDLPFPGGLNPQAALLDRHLDKVAARYEPEGKARRQRWRAGRLERLAARMYPTALAPSLLLGSEVLAWLAEYDDYLAGLPPRDEERAARRLRTTTLGVLAGQVAERPVLPAGLLWDICAWIRRAGEPGWQLRFSADVEGFADAMQEKARSRTSGRGMTPRAYRRLRREASGWMLLADVAELAGGGPLPDEVVSAEHYRKLRDLAGDLSCAVSDLASNPADLAAQEHPNLVGLLALQSSRPLTAAEARELVATTTGERLADYRAARAGFLSRHPEQAGYVRAIEHLIRGGLDWTLESGQYPELASTTSED